MMLLPIAAGINGGRDRGAIVGFTTGSTLDLVVHGTPTGFFALGYTLVGYSSAWHRPACCARRGGYLCVTAFAGSALGIVTARGARKVPRARASLRPPLLTVCAVVAVINAALVLPMTRVVRWSMPVVTRSGRLVPT